MLNFGITAERRRELLARGERVRKKVAARFNRLLNVSQEKMQRRFS